jgi:hypothetical protein
VVLIEAHRRRFAGVHGGAQQMSCVLQVVGESNP